MTALLFPSLLSGSVTKQQIRIAVLDSGYNEGLFPRAKLCEDGHKDFTGHGLRDNLWHGTHVINTMVNQIKHSDYCIVIVKWFDPYMPLSRSKDASDEAFTYVSTLNVDILNYSAGGPASSTFEKALLEKILKRGVKVFVAAGNEAQDLNVNCNYFPACYKLKGLNVIGNKTPEGPVSYSSNYGNVVNQWEVGTNVRSYDGTKMRSASGTSQATAVATGKWVNGRR